MASCLINSECVDLKNKLYNMTWWATAINQITVPSGMSMSGGSTAVITTSAGVDIYKYNASTSSWKKCSSYATQSEFNNLSEKVDKIDSRICLANHSERTITGSNAIVNFSDVSFNNNSDVFQRVSDGGIKCKKAGKVKVESMVRSYQLTPGDIIGINVEIYRGGQWPFVSSHSTAVSGDVATNVLIDTITVEANDTIYICISNQTASRGKTSDGGIFYAEYV